MQTISVSMLIVAVRSLKTEALQVAFLAAPRRNW